MKVCLLLAKSGCEYRILSSHCYELRRFLANSIPHQTLKITIDVGAETDMVSTALPKHQLYNLQVFANSIKPQVATTNLQTLPPLLRLPTHLPLQTTRIPRLTIPPPRIPIVPLTRSEPSHNTHDNIPHQTPTNTARLTIPLQAAKRTHTTIKLRQLDPPRAHTLPHRARAPALTNPHFQPRHHDSSDSTIQHSPTDGER